MYACSRPDDTLPRPQFLTSKVASRFTDAAEIPVTALARAMRFAGESGPAGLATAGVGNPPADSFKRAETAKGSITVLGNGEAKKLAASLEGK